MNNERTIFELVVIVFIGLILIFGVVYNSTILLESEGVASSTFREPTKEGSEQ